MVKRGDVDTGLALLREELNRAGDARFLPRFLLLLGELAACFGEAEQVGQGLAVVEDALARCNDRQEQWYLPELMRIKGELMRKEPAACRRRRSALPRGDGHGRPAGRALLGAAMCDQSGAAR